MAAKRKRRVLHTIGREEVSEALDTLAEIIEATNNRKLLPVFERLENELVKYEHDDAVFKRATKRARENRAKKK